MKKLRSIFLFFAILLPLLLSAQTIEEIIQKYKHSLDQIQSISYTVRQLDTFTTGHVWDHVGEVVLQKSAEDTLFGFHYFAFKDTIERRALYDGQREFQIFPIQKKYELNINPRQHILGSPGGQLIVPEMMYYQDDTLSPQLVFDKDQIILLYKYPDLTEYQVSNRVKKIYIDGATFLPTKVIKRQVSLGEKQVITRFIKNIETNLPIHEDRFDKGFLETYEPIVRKRPKNPYKDLIASQVKDFTLMGFNEQPVSIKEKEGKVVLIDFWEVWCGPCVQSMPKVQALYEQYQDKGLEVMGVLLDKNSKDSAQLLLEKKGFSFPHALGTKELLSYFKVTGIPQYVLIDKTGKIQYIYMGFNDEIENNVKQLLSL